MKTKFISALFFSFVILFFAGKISIAQAAPRLYLDPATKTVNNGSSFQINLVIDAENQSAFGAEAIINYPTDDLNLVSVANGGFFTDFTTPSSSNGKINVRGFFSQTFDSKTGNGTFAVLNFTSKKGSGTGTISFTCSSGNDTFILDSSGNNILNCGNVNQTNLTFSSDSSPTNSPTSTPAPGEPNSCGGTCGSDSNCKSGYYCYSGRCRNPSCPTTTNCVCPTVKPTAKPIAKIVTKISPTPTSQIVTTTPYKQSTFIVSTPTPDATESGTKKQSSQPNYLLIGGITILAGILILVISKVFKRKPKNIIPPTQNPPPVYPPFQEPPIQEPPAPIPPQQENPTNSINLNPPQETPV